MQPGVGVKELPKPRRDVMLRVIGSAMGPMNQSTTVLQSLLRLLIRP
jgi:hypothetical protein